MNYNSIKPAQIFKTIVKQCKKGKIKIFLNKRYAAPPANFSEIVLISQNFNSMNLTKFSFLSQRGIEPIPGGKGVK